MAEEPNQSQEAVLQTDQNTAVVGLGLPETLDGVLSDEDAIPSTLMPLMVFETKKSLLKPTY